MIKSVVGSDRFSVFLSYSRDDLAFADQLDAALRVCGFATAIDRHSISGGEDWKRRLGALIRDADTIAFILSPDSVRSSMCAWEVEEATRLGKRIIPVLCRDLAGAALPERLSDLNYIAFVQHADLPDAGFGTGLTRLVEALNTDFEWLREHTRLMARATEWDRGGRPSSRLLSGADVPAAKDWQGRRPPNAPAPTDVQLEFIRTSEAEEARRQSTDEQRLRQVAEAQAARETALIEKEAALAREAEMSKRAVADAERIADEQRRVVRRTRQGLAASLAFAVLAGGFGAYAVKAGRDAQASADEARAATRVATAAKIEALDAVSKLNTVNAELTSTNVRLEEARTLAESRREAAETATREAVVARGDALAAAERLTISIADLEKARTLAESRREAAETATREAVVAKGDALAAAERLTASIAELEKTNVALAAARSLAEARREAADRSLDLMLEQLVIKATFDSVQTRRPFAFAQVDAKEGDSDFQRALRLAPDADELWTRLARALMKFAEAPPQQLRSARKELEWAQHANLIMTRVVRRRDTPERAALKERIDALLARYAVPAATR